MANAVAVARRARHASLRDGIRPAIARACGVVGRCRAGAPEYLGVAAQALGHGGLAVCGQRLHGPRMRCPLPGREHGAVANPALLGPDVAGIRRCTGKKALGYSGVVLT